MFGDCIGVAIVCHLSRNKLSQGSWEASKQSLDGSTPSPKSESPVIANYGSKTESKL